MLRFPKSLSLGKVLPLSLNLNIQLLLRQLNVNIYEALVKKSKYLGINSFTLKIYISVFLLIKKSECHP